MKVLQVNCVYGEESTGKIVADHHRYLQAAGVSSVVCYGRGSTAQEPHVYRLCSNTYARAWKAAKMLAGPLYGGSLLSTGKLEGIIRREKPDVVHLHCLNGDFINIYRLIRFLKTNKIPTLLTLHAEFMYTANCGYALDCEKWRTGCGRCPRARSEMREMLLDWTGVSWKRMKQSFDGFDDLLAVASVSPWLEDRAKQSPILKDKKHCTVLNGIDTDSVFHYTKSDLRERMGLENQKVVLYVTASFSRPIKGGRYALEMARRLQDCTFVIIGNEDAIKDQPSNVLSLGRINDQKELARYYSMADVLLLTSQKETFCMPVAESLCCGTPVVGFEAGAPEQIALPEYSRFTAFGNTDLLEAALRDMLRQDWDKQTISDEAVRKYSLRQMSLRYLELYRGLLHEN